MKTSATLVALIAILATSPALAPGWAAAPTRVGESGFGNNEFGDQRPLNRGFDNATIVGGRP